MRQAFIRLTYYNSKEPFSLNPDHVVLFQRFVGSSSQITLVTGDEIFVKESTEELEALLNE